MKFDANGLIPTVVQDADTGIVLMVAWMNEESIAATHSTGKVTFWSRSRNELWQKGLTSGNELNLVSISPDCDEDTLLVRARPSGPVCHTGSATCFDEAAAPPFAAFGTLAATIAERSQSRPPSSYTTTLLNDPDLAARKVLEEAGEVAFAAKDLAVNGNERTRLVEEIADLTYHVLTLAAAHQVSVEDVSDELRRRA